jgi:hypothetical protein
MIMQFLWKTCVPIVDKYMQVETAKYICDQCMLLMENMTHVGIKGIPYA